MHALRFVRVRPALYAPRIRPPASRTIMSEQPEILSVEELPNDQAKWVKLKKVNWKDQEGKTRVWECAERTTRGSGGIDAVAIFAVLQAPGQKTATILVEQFRPPLGTTTIEMPAGLVDGDETAEETAIRELREETGYEAEEVLDSSPILACDPGMTTANMKLVTLRVPVSDTMPQQHLDPGEHIVRHIVQLDTLYDTLKDFTKKGHIVDARLAHFAAAIAITRKIGEGSLKL